MTVDDLLQGFLQQYGIVPGQDPSQNNALQGGFGAGSAPGTSQSNQGPAASAASTGPDLGRSHGGGIGLDLGAFGDRLPSSRSLDFTPAQSFALGTATQAMGPAGTALGGLNMMGNAVNTGLNAQALGQMGINLGLGQMIGGGLGLNGYGGTLASAMNQSMDTTQGRAALSGPQQQSAAPAEPDKVQTAPVDNNIEKTDLAAPAGTGPAVAEGGADGGPGQASESGSGQAGQAGGGQGAAEGDPNGGFSKGGLVTVNKLTGPNPPGPDNGFASLQTGEGVLTKRAMDHYGPRFLAKLNKLQVPKAKEL